jgi:hypothetical protein
MIIGVDRVECTANTTGPETCHGQERRRVESFGLVASQISSARVLGKVDSIDVVIRAVRVSWYGGGRAYNVLMRN